MSDYNLRDGDIKTTLSIMKAKRDIAGLLSLIHDGNEAYVVDALAKIGSDQAVDALASIYANQQYPLIHRDAVFALVKICTVRTLPALIAALEDKDGILRIKAAAALGQIGDVRAIDALIAHLEDSYALYRNDTEWDVIETTVGKSAAEALQKITGQEFRYDNARWQQWWSKNRSKILKNRRPLPSWPPSAVAPQPIPAAQRSISSIPPSTLPISQPLPAAQRSPSPVPPPIPPTSQPLPAVLHPVPPASPARPPSRWSLKSLIPVILGSLLLIMGVCWSLILLIGQFAAAPTEPGKIPTIVGSFACVSLPLLLIGAAFLFLGLRLYKRAPPPS